MRMKDFLDFRTLGGLSSTEKEFQMVMFRHVNGQQAVRCIYTFPYEVDEDPEDWGNVMKKLECYCLGFTNDNFERYKFNCSVQEPGESVDQFVQAVTVCNCMHDKLIKERLIIGMRNGNLTKRMLGYPQLTLKRRTDMRRSEENVNRVAAKEP
ncbi:hypothetical protein PHET_07924 [Paragonimus heterotremus]|uniref:Uncharacterized protein n=1 Tax=Paragonimus heterotremus TaxID=100268 RepID=A0A8J4SM96_9TREM|nr:hypothetical protein PHET_07924 [Paragonimus heterotremus]